MLPFVATCKSGEQCQGCQFCVSGELCPDACIGAPGCAFCPNTEVPSSAPIIKTTSMPPNNFISNHPAFNRRTKLEERKMTETFPSMTTVFDGVSNQPALSRRVQEVSQHPAARKTIEEDEKSVHYGAVVCSELQFVSYGVSAPAPDFSIVVYFDDTSKVVTDVFSQSQTELYPLSTYRDASNFYYADGSTVDSKGVSFTSKNFGGSFNCEFSTCTYNFHGGSTKTSHVVDYVDINGKSHSIPVQITLGSTQCVFDPQSLHISASARVTEISEPSVITLERSSEKEIAGPLTTTTAVSMLAGVAALLLLASYVYVRVYGKLFAKISTESEHV